MDYKEKVITLLKSQELSKEPKEKLHLIFPELKESEDERIRKSLCKAIWTYIPTEEGQEYIAWLEKQGQTFTKKDIDDAYLKGVCDAKHELEKQGEQKPANKTEPKFKNGQWIVWQDKCYKVNYNGCGYELVDQNGLSTSLEYGTIDENAHLWTIQDAKDGDVLFQDLMGGKTFIYNGVNSDMAILYSFIISNDGEDVLPYHIGKPNTGIGNIEENKNIIHPATKEQRDTLIKAMTDAGYTFDFEKKALKKIEQNSIEPDNLIEESYQQQADDLIDMVTEKPAWSEEDEKTLNEIFSVAARASLRKSTLFGKSYDYIKWQNWLKSLRPQSKQVLRDTFGYEDGRQFGKNEVLGNPEKYGLQRFAEWSKSDKEIVKEIDTIIHGTNSISDEVRKKLQDWLKSLRPQNTWKPSEGQMRALGDINLTGGISYAGQGQELINLYNDLKKLRG